MKPAASQTQPGLYIVATPIGNLRDITLRALDVLQAADLIACEDTRTSGVLLKQYGIGAPTLSYNDHNGEERRPAILKALAEGKRVALISDAGTPLISDPGYKLVREAQAHGHYVTTLPGPSSAIAALCLSGLPSDRFFFAGFLPARQEACRKTIQALAPIPSTLLLFESPRRLQETLRLLHSELGDREAAVVREISKLYEETRRAPLSQLCAHYEAHGDPKGEIVLVVAPPRQETASAETLERKMRLLLASHNVKEAAAILAEESGRPRKELYSLALRLKQDEG